MGSIRKKVTCLYTVTEVGVPLYGTTNNLLLTQKKMQYWMLFITNLQIDKTHGLDYSLLTITAMAMVTEKSSKPIPRP